MAVFTPSARAPLFAALALAASLTPSRGQCAEWLVTPGEGSLSAAVQAAAPGDTLVLAAGVHRGSVVVDRPLLIFGQTGAVVDGGRTGRALVIDAPDSVIRGLTVTGSGLSLATEDSGVFVTENGDRALIEGNSILDNLIGIYLKGPAAAVVRGNRIIGRRDLRLNERGNGIHLWNSPGSVVKGNDVSYGRDGIFVTTSRKNIFTANRFTHVRFAVHYMYTNDSEVSDNVSKGNHIGYAIMFSHGLDVARNVSEGDRDRGLLLNYANESRIVANRILPGPEKCVFIYNANLNEFEGNRFEGCEIGIHFTAGSEGNRIFNNAFVANRTQVKYVGTRVVEWSEAGRGNYWSDNLDFDLNGDGVADRPYRPNDLVDQIVWRHPLARLLLSSPAVQALRFAQSEFPGLHPGGVVDFAPLMKAPMIAGAGGLP